MQKYDCILLYEYFLEIKKKGYFKLLTNNSGEIGLNFEKNLGYSGGDFNIPDFKGIEIKCVNKDKKNDICLSSITPNGKVPFPILELAKKYGYPDQIYNDKKVLVTRCYSNKGTKFGIFNSTKLYVDYKGRKIVLKIFDYYGHVLDDSIYWSFDEVKEKITRKISNLAIIKYELCDVGSKKYYRYIDIDFYLLRDFRIFLKLIECGIIYISIDVGVIKTGKYKGLVRDHGCSFNIKYINLFLLFSDYYLYKKLVQK